MLTVRQRRIFTLLLTAAVCFAMLFSLCFLAAEADHDCTGEDCAVCAQISNAENILRAVLCTAAGAAAAAAVCSVVRVIEAAEKKTLTGTLITLKTELLN